jgi:N-acyl-D-amino-acid deacylase
MRAATYLHTTRRRFLRLSVGLGIAGLPNALSAQDHGPTPVELDIVASGERVRGLESFDRLLASYMTLHEVPGAALAVTKDSRLVYARGFGYGDIEKRQPVQPTSLFRIGSVAKSITSVAVLQLVERGKLALEDKILDLLNLEPHLAPGAKVDPRWRAVTVLHLLQHTGGWDRDKSPDPLGHPAVAEALNIKPPAMPQQVIRYMLGRPLDFDPGSRFAYSNFGFLVLGYLVETFGKKPYAAHVRQEVLAPLGVFNMWPAAVAEKGRRPDEVRYYDPTSPNAPYTAYLDPAVGGWLASAVDLVRFATAFDNPQRCPILSDKSIQLMFAPPAGAVGHEADGRPKLSYYGCGWYSVPVAQNGVSCPWHGGGLPGTTAVLARRFEHDGVNWAVVMNRFTSLGGEFLGNTLRNLLHDRTTKIRSWPGGDRFREFKPGR